MGSNQEPIDPKKLSHWKLLSEFRRRLADAHALSPDSPPDDPRRKLLIQLYQFGYIGLEELMDRLGLEKPGI